MSQVILFVSGGDADTSEYHSIVYTITQIAQCLGREEHTNLLIDLSSRSNATDLLLAPDAQRTHTVAEALKNELAFIDLVQPSTVPHLDVLPGGPANSPAHTALTARSGASELLVKALVPLREYYDHILIHSPNYLSVLTVNALVAADAFVYVLGSSMSDSQITCLRQTTRKVRRHLERIAPVLGVLSSVRCEDIWELEEKFQSTMHHFGGKTLFTELPALHSSSGDGQPTPAALLNVYQHLADDLQERMHRYQKLTA